MNHWSVRQMQGKPKTKEKKPQNKTSNLVPIGAPAEAIMHHLTKVKISTKNPLIP